MNILPCTHRQLLIASDEKNSLYLLIPGPDGILQLQKIEQRKFSISSIN
jgi:hypothetical protein